MLFKTINIRTITFQYKRSFYGTKIWVSAIRYEPFMLCYLPLPIMWKLSQYPTYQTHIHTLCKYNLPKKACRRDVGFLTLGAFFPHFGQLTVFRLGLHFPLPRSVSRTTIKRPMASNTQRIIAITKMYFILFPTLFFIFYLWQ